MFGKKVKALQAEVEELHAQVASLEAHGADLEGFVVESAARELELKEAIKRLRAEYAALSDVAESGSRLIDQQLKTLGTYRQVTEDLKRELHLQHEMRLDEGWAGKEAQRLIEDALDYAIKLTPNADERYVVVDGDAWREFRRTLVLAWAAAGVGADEP